MTKQRLLATLAAGTVLLASCASTVPGTPAAKPSARTSSAQPNPVISNAHSSMSTSSPTSPPASVSTSASSPAQPAPGSTVGTTGFGDPYYPQAGNGGYQVDTYRLAISYLPDTNVLTGSALLSMVVTQPSGLGEFSVDLQPTMQVSAVTVDTAAAPFQQQEAKLIVRPRALLPAGATVTVTVTYTGQPALMTNGTTGLGDGGWYRTSSGGAVAVGQPFSASAWYPVNEHPADQAAYDIVIDVPEGWNAIASGTKTEPEKPGPTNFVRSRYVQTSPVSSYLSTVWIDKFTEDRRNHNGLDVHSAYLSANTKARTMAALTVPVVTGLSKVFGPYPYPSAGGIFTSERLSFALETAARPVYANWVDEDTVVHEIAHQWYGNLVPIAQWRDICLNECMASYAPWLWAEQKGHSLKNKWATEMVQYSDESFWGTPLVDMGTGNEFSSVYNRGPLAIHVLRHQMGDDAFFKLAKAWPTKRANKPSRWEDFEALAQQLARQDLSKVFAVWFRGRTMPTKADYPAALR